MQLSKTFIWLYTQNRARNGAIWAFVICHECRNFTFRTNLHSFSRGTNLKGDSFFASFMKQNELRIEIVQIGRIVEVYLGKMDIHNML